MASRIMCECGEILVEEVTREGVRPLDSDEVIPFRRTTDYVMCASCLRTYNVRALIAQTQDADIIDLLERLEARGLTPPAG